MSHSKSRSTEARTAEAGQPPLFVIAFFNPQASLVGAIYLEVAASESRVYVSVNGRGNSAGGNYSYAQDRLGELSVRLDIQAACWSATLDGLQVVSAVPASASDGPGAPSARDRLKLDDWVLVSGSGAAGGIRVEQESVGAPQFRRDGDGSVEYAIDLADWLNPPGDRVTALADGATAGCLCRIRRVILT